MNDGADNGMDEKLADRLNARAPAPRDPLFRVGVLQRREEDQFRLRNRLMLAGAGLLGFAALAAFVFRPDLAPEIGAMLAGAAVLGGGFLYRDNLLDLVRRFSL